MLCLDNFNILKKNLYDVTDAGSSTRHKKNCPTLGNNKFGFIVPPVPLLT